MSLVASMLISPMMVSHLVCRRLSSKARFPSKRNRLRCVRCVWMETGLNTGFPSQIKQPIMVVTASTEHPIVLHERH